MSFFRAKLSPAGVPQTNSPRRKNAGLRMPGASTVFIALAVAFLALLLGAVVALGSNQLTLILAGIMLIVPVVAVVNTKNLLPVLFVFTFLVQGMAQYAFNLRLAAWLGSGLGALFFARAVLELSSFNGRRERAPKPAFGASAVIVASFLYLSFFFFGMAIGHLSLPKMISAFRFCVPMFGVLFALYWFEWPLNRLQTLWKLIAIVTVIQLPIVIYQHFFMMSSLGWDGVVGTFGLGMSATLVLFSTSGLLYVVARWVRGLSGPLLPAAMLAVVLAISILGEVKAVFIWLPLTLFLILRQRVLKNIFAFVTFGLFIGLFMGGTYGAYKALYWGDVIGGGKTVEEKLDRTGGYFFDPRSVNYTTGEVGRGASMYLWYRDPMPTLVERLVGYGPGASATNAGTGQGIVAVRYRRLAINATAISALLWDVGVLGLLAFLAIPLTGIVAGLRYVKFSGADPERLAIVDVSTVTMIMLSTTVIYNRALLDESTLQLLMFFSLGCIVHFCRYRHADATAAQPLQKPRTARAGALPGR
jgi:hypothetical protein